MTLVSKRLLKIFTVVIFFCLLFSFHPKSTQADSNFTTDYHVTYIATETGMTHTLLNVTLTNTTTQYYASSYKMQLGFDAITNVSARDPDGSINPVISNTPDGYEIAVTFNKKSVGQGSKLNFTITFDTPTIAKRYGKIWEINIPGIANPDDFQTFGVDVKTPPSFGKPVYIKPYQSTSTLSFTKQQLGRSGISIAFGDTQIYAFNLAYHMRNTNVFPIKTEIALPPSTNYQDVFITNISPQPSNVLVDKDGNWLAQYSLFPSQKIDVIVQGKAKVHLSPSQELLTQAQLSEYLTEKPYWQTKNTEISELAKELKTPNAIYNYVVKTLKYDFTRVSDNKPRLGAVEALKEQDSAVCREFTDLFIALARAAGIPAREVDGFAYTENAKQRPLSLVQDILHAWPEYYDTQKKTWVMVDPTWGSTTGGVDYYSVLDYDHFAFVIKGEDSSYPIPAGGYKYDANKNSKDVQVTFSDVIPDAEQTVDLTTTLPKQLIAGFPIAGKIILKNVGSAQIDPQAIAISSSSLLPHQQAVAASVIPPFGYTAIDFDFRRTGFLTNSKDTFTIRVVDKSISQNVKIAPLFLTGWGIGGISLVVLTCIILIIARKGRRLRVSR